MDAGAEDVDPDEPLFARVPGRALAQDGVLPYRDLDGGHPTLR
jgi:hypothetical protein